MDREKVKQAFLKDVSNFEIKILRDDNLYRHIRCGHKNGSSNHRFWITTWPGYLAITGDMGDFLFSRIEDMFIFFRDPHMRINPSYWDEKVKATSVFGDGTKKFSVEKFREAVLNDARENLGVNDLNQNIMKELDPLLSLETEYECIHAIQSFYSEKVAFYDFWEHDTKEWTFHFIWLCYAIVWTINEYDRINIGAEPPRDHI